MKENEGTTSQKKNPIFIKKKKRILNTVRGDLLGE